MNILYISTSDKENISSIYLSQALCQYLKHTRHKFYILADFYLKNNLSENKIEEEKILEISWDLLLIQNAYSYSVYNTIFKRLKKIPSFFISYDLSIKGIPQISEQVQFVLSFCDNNILTNFVPDSFIISTIIPITNNNYIKKEKRKDNSKNIFYYPTQNSTKSDLFLISLISRSGNKLFIISDSHFYLDSLCNENIKLISRKKSIKMIKTAHLVIGNNYDIIKSLALQIPCIVLGKQGLGGIVKLSNYETLKYYSFNGRAGGYENEHIPNDLFSYQITYALLYDNPDEQKELQQNVLTDFSYKIFHKKMSTLFQHFNHIRAAFNDLNKFKFLIPFLTDKFSITKQGGIDYINLNNKYYLEIDRNLLELILECDGKKSIIKITQEYNLEKDHISLFYNSIKELYTYKLINFK